MDISAFASILVVLGSIFWMAVYGAPQPHHRSSVDLPGVTRALLMPNALREDAMLVVIHRDSNIYFGPERVSIDQLPALIRTSLAGGSERKVYIRADSRAKYRSLATVLDGVQAAGVQNVAFIVEERRTVPVPSLIVK